MREAVYKRVVEEIVSGRYAPGAALTEASLSRALDVSRTPVREALLRLEAEGVLESMLARGFIIKPLSTTEAAELYPVLAALEVLAVEQGHERLQERLSSLHATLDELESAEDALSRWQLDSRFHDELVAASANRRLVSLVHQLRTSLSRYELTYMQAVRQREAADNDHRAVLEALAAGNPHDAGDILRRHWHAGRDLVCAWIEDTTG